MTCSTIPDRHHSFPRLTLLLAGLLLAGCGGVRDDTPPRYPVRGELRFNGAPAAGATVKFLALSGAATGVLGSAPVGADGQFSASYLGYEDGLPAGNYSVLVIWLESPPAGGLPFDRLRGQFCDAAHPVTTITITPGENQLPPINLESGQR